MAADKKCTRCGADVPEILSGPPDERNTWWRYQIRMARKEVTHRLVFRSFTRQWLPVDPSDQLRETYTTLDLCDRCAGDMLLFAQAILKPEGEQEAAAAALDLAAEEITEMSQRMHYARSEHVTDPEAARDALLGGKTALDMAISRLRSRAAELRKATP